MPSSEYEVERTYFEQHTRTIVERFWSVSAEPEKRNRERLKAILQRFGVQNRAVLGVNQIVWRLFGWRHGSRAILIKLGVHFPLGSVTRRVANDRTDNVKWTVLAHWRLMH